MRGRTGRIVKKQYRCSTNSLLVEEDDDKGRWRKRGQLLEAIRVHSGLSVERLHGCEETDRGSRSEEIVGSFEGLQCQALHDGADPVIDGQRVDGLVLTLLARADRLHRAGSRGVDVHGGQRNVYKIFVKIEWKDIC